MEVLSLATAAQASFSADRVLSAAPPFPSWEAKGLVSLGPTELFAKA